MAKMVVILTHGYADWECALLVAATRTFYGVDVVTASPDGNKVISAGGFRVTPDMSVADIDARAIDILVLNGGTAWEGDAAPDVAALLHDMRALGKPVAAICAAVRAFAGAGLLDGVAHTGNSADELGTVARYQGHQRFVAQPSAVSDNGIVTAPGTAPVSFMTAVCAAIGIGGPEFDYYIGLYGAEHRLS
jgi:putative intracellular protease/amidase